CPALGAHLAGRRAIPGRLMKGDSPGIVTSCEDRGAQLFARRLTEESVPMPAKIELLAAAPEGTESILSPEALAFVADLHTQFAGRRAELLAKRDERAAEIEAGAKLGFLPETEAIRTGEWQVGPAPADL